MKLIHHDKEEGIVFKNAVHLMYFISNYFLLIFAMTGVVGKPLQNGVLSDESIPNLTQHVSRPEWNLYWTKVKICIHYAT
jgi:hypothetical protein